MRVPGLGKAECSLRLGLPRASKPRRLSLLVHDAPILHTSSQQHFLIHCLAPRVKQNVGTWVPPKQPMTLSWIGQKTPGAGGVTKPKVFGLQVALSGHQAQILEPRDKGVCVLWCCIIVWGVNSQVGVGFV